MREECGGFGSPSSQRKEVKLASNLQPSPDFEIYAFPPPNHRRFDCVIAFRVTLVTFRSVFCGTTTAPVPRSWFRAAQTESENLLPPPPKTFFE